MRKTEFDQVLFGRSFLVQEISPDLPAEESWRRIPKCRNDGPAFFGESSKGGYALYGLYARQSVEKQDSISVESQLEFCRFETKGKITVPISTGGSAGRIPTVPALRR